MFQYCAIVVLLLAAFPSIKSQCTSDPGDPCSATCNGTKISIRSALQYPVIVNNDKYNYTFSPCAGATCGFANPSSTDNAMCQRDPSSKDSSTYSLGKIAGAVWNVTNSDPSNLAFTIVYSGGDDASNIKRSTKVTFTVGSSDLSYVNEDVPAAQYLFSVQAPASSYTAAGGDIAGPIGLVLIFLAIAAFIAYFVIGGLVMYFVKGARGIEVIPNYTFWKDFPFLLKDAMLFIVSPCYKRSSYDKI